MKDIIISLAILLLLIIFNIYQVKKNKQVYKKDLYKKIKRLKSYLYLGSIIVFITFLIINLIPLGTKPLFNEIITSIINALSISLLSIPISLETLYLRYFNDEEKYSHTKTIVTNIYNKEIIDKLNKSDINVILLSQNKTKLKSIKEDQITSNILKETIQIKTSNLKIIDKKINKENTIKEYKDIISLYNKIEKSRNIHENYIRAIKYLVTSNLSVLLSYIFLIIMKFPITYNILLISILKLYTTITSTYLYKHLPYDKDVMNRKVKPSNMIITKQELIFLIMENFILAFAMTTPYMYVLSSGASSLFANTLFIVAYIILNTLLSYYYINDSSFIKNIIVYIKNIRLHIFTIISIILIFIFNNTNYFQTRNITLQNNIACLIISVITILILEVTKLARYTTKKGNKKNETKNN